MGKKIRGGERVSHEGCIAAAPEVDHVVAHSRIQPQSIKADRYPSRGL